MFIKNNLSRDSLPSTLDAQLLHLRIAITLFH